VNQLDFISHYSPIRDDEHGGYSAAPEYFGMLAFAQASKGRLISAAYDAASLNLTAYAVENSPRQFTVTLINKEATQAAAVSIASPRSISQAHASLLTAPSLESKEGVRLSPYQGVNIKNRECQVHLPAASAAVVTLKY